MSNDTNTIQFGSDAKTLEETVDTLAAVADASGIHLWFDTADGRTVEYNADTLHEMKGFVNAGVDDGMIDSEIVLTVDE